MFGDKRFILGKNTVLVLASQLAICEQQYLDSPRGAFY